MERESFGRLVREALNHLYDHAYLERHPLRDALIPSGSGGNSGLTLHRVLLEGLEGLRPPAHVPRTAARWRPYLLLSLRYVDGLEPAQVAQELAIGERQFRREQSRGLEQLTAALWARTQQAPGAEADASPSALLDAEVARLRADGAGGSISLEEVLAGVLETLGGLAQARGVAFAPRLPVGLPSVNVERVALRQVLLGALGHVVDSSPRGTVEVSARAEGREVLVRLAHRGEAATPRPATRDEQRLGVAARLLESHGGRLELRLEEGELLTLHLPLEPSPTVLVVDDNPDVILLFRRYLSGSPYRVVEATGCAEALRLAREVMPATITVDVMMPGQDGWELLQGLKVQPETAGIPVLVCSVLHERELAMSLGAAGFLAKPVSQAALLAALARLAGRGG